MNFFIEEKTRRQIDFIMILKTSVQQLDWENKANKKTILDILQIIKGPTAKWYRGEDSVDARSC